MIKEIRKLSIASKAKEVLQDMQFSTLPINPIAIAQHFNIGVEPKPSNTKGVSGMLIKQGDNFGIMYATHIKNRGFQNFSIAHELGHYLLDGHIDNILNNGVHVSDSEFSYSNKYEWEADWFASELLMPNFLIRDDIRQNDLTWQLVSNIANKCKTSLEATARRVIAISKEPCALLIQHDNKVWTPVKSPAWSWFLNKALFPKELLDCSDYEDMPDTMEKCDLVDWGIENINLDEYQCYYSSIYYEGNNVNKIMSLLLLE